MPVSVGPAENDSAAEAFTAKRPSGAAESGETTIQAGDLGQRCG